MTLANTFIMSAKLALLYKVILNESAYLKANGVGLCRSAKVCCSRELKSYLLFCLDVSCTKLLAPLNGRIAKYDIDNITFSCFDGYDMIGADQLVCMPNGQWNGKAPRCIRNYGKSSDCLGLSN